MTNAYARYKDILFDAAKFIFIAGDKLCMKPVPLATAATLYHKFYRIHGVADFDPYTIASSCLYLAGKLEEEKVRIRDVINVAHRTLHPDKKLLDINETYWELRESITKCELFILRSLQFQVHFCHPHNYLLHYLKSICDWLDPSVDICQLSKISWSLLQDSYLSDVCLNVKPDKMAVSILYLSLQCLGLHFPHADECSLPWYEVLSEHITLKEIKDASICIMESYELLESLEISK